jgi:hypothetical protein
LLPEIHASHGSVVALQQQVTRQTLCECDRG